MFECNSPHKGLGTAPLVVGVDEAGRGRWRGLLSQQPAWCCASRVRAVWTIRRNSPAKRRAVLEPQIRERCAWGWR